MKRKQQRQGTSSISAMRTTTADTASKKSDQDDVQLKLYETRAAGNSRETIIGSAEKHMEMKLRQLSALLCSYLALDEANGNSNGGGEEGNRIWGSSNGFGFDPHIGRSMALEIGRRLNQSAAMYGAKNSAGETSGAIDPLYSNGNDATEKEEQALMGLYDNTSAFLHKFGEQRITVGRWFEPESRARLKAELSKLYSDVRSGKVELTSNDYRVVSYKLAEAGKMLVRSGSDEALDIELDKLSPLSSLPISDTINREAMFSSLSVPTTPVAPARLAPSYSFPSSDDPFPAQQMQSAAPSASSSLSNPALHMMAFPDNRNFGDALISGGGNSTDKPESTNHFSLSNTFGYNQPATTTNTTTSEDGNNNDNNNNNNQQRHHRRDVGKFVLEPALSQDGWRNLVRDAWVADPKLAIYLPVRFSNPAVVNELQSLVHAYPGELVSDPESLKFFMGLLGSSSNSNSNTNANIDTDDEDERFGSGNNTRSLSKLRNSFGLLAHKHSQQYPQHEGKHQLVDDSLVQNNSWIISLLNDPAKMDMGIKTFRELKFMLYYISVPPVTSISVLSSDLVSEPLVLQYAMRSLEKYPVEVTFFNVPQLVQALRFDKQGYVEAAIVDASKISQLFAHQIIWNIKANSYKDDEGKVPDMQIKPALDRVTKKIIDLFSLDDSAFYKREFSFFTKVTAISGSLKPYIKKSKGEKKKKIDEEMQKIVVDKGVYLPSNPDCTVVGIDYLSGRPLQSHAKAPFMATFYIQPNSLLKSDDVQELVGSTSSSSSSSSSTANSTPATTTPSIKEVDANSVSSEGGKELELQKLDLNFDFGFILGIAPGGITFESAPFKLTAEYIQNEPGVSTTNILNPASAAGITEQTMLESMGKRRASANDAEKYTDYVNEGMDIMGERRKRKLSVIKPKIGKKKSGASILGTHVKEV
ncbi:Phosphatidylinositol 4-kinase stt4 [Zancudomyces culisetae]|uniref:1-phosphatidylinositol 4-kinase n=1 Tax=Zancudomyces culisetae TaxID=1213189 RepID=A0A1R1PPY5_ZANCU|nr:Phosphatidylinositol 4-kinase stt4 [Zancudomyces culisetae]|eukprot:OMH82942.1 Phosphatidylinositol 4-kinase stt4 [Zancudomyces culisetae]